MNSIADRKNHVKVIKLDRLIGIWNVQKMHIAF